MIGLPLASGIVSAGASTQVSFDQTCIIFRRERKPHREEKLLLLVQLSEAITRPGNCNTMKLSNLPGEQNKDEETKDVDKAKSNTKSTEPNESSRLQVDYGGQRCPSPTLKEQRRLLKEEQKSHDDDDDDDDDDGDNGTLNWDDEGFELDQPNMKKIEMKKELTASGNAIQRCIDDDDEEEEDWLQIASLEQMQRKQQKTKADGQQLYLTAQFQNLNTPVSRKKPRCAVCTRPLQQEQSNTSSNNPLSSLCPMCRSTKEVGK